MLSASFRHPGESCCTPNCANHQERAVDVAASAHYHEKAVDVACLLPQPRRELLILPLSAHNLGESC
jgi:hypothetical protein